MNGMGAQPEHLLDSMTSRYAAARRLLARLSAFASQVTFKIKRGSPAETVEELGRKWRLDAKRRQFLIELGATKTGAKFIDEKVQDINRSAFHRSAFALNAIIQLGFVDLAAQLSMSAPWLKLALVTANVVLAGVAHFEMRQLFRALVAGPNALPPKRRLWGMLRNPKYNRAIKKSSRLYARSAWKEKSLYRPAYFFNAISIFIGSQFIIAPEKLIFPFGLIIGKISGLFSTLAMMFDVWRGVRAGDDARIAREREVSVYRDLDI
jgi:hypothetical protein